MHAAEADKCVSNFLHHNCLPQLHAENTACLNEPLLGKALASRQGLGGRRLKTPDFDTRNHLGR